MQAFKTLVLSTSISQGEYESEGISFTWQHATPVINVTWNPLRCKDNVLYKDHNVKIEKEQYLTKQHNKHLYIQHMDKLVKLLK